MGNPRIDDIHTRKTNPRDTIPMNEGEGSVTADREYREGVAKTLAEKDVEALAEEAKEALDGPEGEALREAEQKGKKAVVTPQANKQPAKRDAKKH